MKLFYFNIKGRPEPAKLCLKLAGKEFEDIQFDGADWMSKYKALSPSGQVRDSVVLLDPDSMRVRYMAAPKTWKHGFIKLQRCKPGLSGFRGVTMLIVLFNCTMVANFKAISLFSTPSSVLYRVLGLLQLLFDNLVDRG
jgi:hypothetical protein